MIIIVQQMLYAMGVRTSNAQCIRSDKVECVVIVTDEYL